MSGTLLLAGLCAPLAAIAVLVLPGFGLRAAHELLRRRSERRHGRAPSRTPVEGRPEDLAEPLIVALALSLCVNAALGSLLVLLGTFHTGLMAAGVSVAAAVGVLPFVRSLQRAGATVVLKALGWVLVLSAPTFVPIFEGGYRPSQTFVWFYWQLGRQLDHAHGVPDHVMEWGDAVRWQPDYLNFNLVSQSYAGLTSSFDDPVAVSVWGVPLAMGLTAVTLLVFKLWFRPGPAVAAVALLSASTVFITKIGNNTPEALGLTFGFASVWLAVTAVRSGRRELVALAAVTLALTVSVHAIGAVVCLFLLVAALVVELTAARSWARWLVPLAGSGGAAATLLVVQGVALQGRASPLGDAANPSRTGAQDPTYTFLQHFNGNFRPGDPASATQNWITQSWSWADLAVFPWVSVPVVMGLAAVAALVLRPRAPLHGTATALLLGVLLTASAAWFELRYDTFVPEHTGNSRIGRYAVLPITLLLAATFDVLSSLAERWWEHRRPQPLRLAGWAVVALLCGVLAAETLNTMSGRTQLPRTGRAALAALDELAPPGAVVISNAGTRGTIEYFTDLENPLEGRQPVIEDADTLTSAIRYLRRTHRFLLDPRPGRMERRLSASWLVLVDKPQRLGTLWDYGPPPARFARAADLEVVWRTRGITILRSPTATAVVDSVGPAKDLRPVAALLGVGTALVVGLGVGVVRQRGSLRTGPSGPSGSVGRPTG